MRYIHTVEYYTAQGKKKLAICHTIDVTRGYHVDWSQL